MRKGSFANGWVARCASYSARLAGIGAFAALAGVAHGQTGRVVPITEEPSHHLALTTTHVRVFDVTAAGHATTLIHRHDHDYLFVTLGNADIMSTRTDGSAAAHLVLKDGAVEYAPGGFAHSVTNNLARPFHNITIELLHPSTNVTTCTTGCDKNPPCQAGGACATVTRDITAEQWVADAVTIPPGATWSPDTAWAPRLIVVVTPSELETQGEYESTADTHRNPGNLIWMPVHTNRRVLPGGAVMQRMKPVLKNVGQTPARLVVVQWKG